MLCWVHPVNLWAEEEHEHTKAPSDIHCGSLHPVDDVNVSDHVTKHAVEGIAEAAWEIDTTTNTLAVN